MKFFLRTFVFAFIAIYVTQLVVGGFSYGVDQNITLFLLILAFGLVNIFSPALLRFLGLPAAGPGFLFLAFIINLATLYVLSTLIPFFNIRATVVPELNIFGFVLPSKSLTSTYALIFSALLMVVIINFFEWLSKSSKK